jgi:hypothetical protein
MSICESKTIAFYCNGVARHPENTQKLSRVREDRIMTTWFMRLTLITVLFGSIGSVQAQITYDLRNDWSDTANPNGVWSYRQGTTPLTSGTWAFDFTSQPAWLGTNPASLFRTQSTAGFDVQVGDIVLHSANAEAPLVNVAWTSPSAGTVDVSGGVWMIRDIGRSNNWLLSHNGVQISSGALASGDPFNRSNPFDLNAGSGGIINDLSVQSGDIIQLAFQQTTGGVGDYIGANLIINFTPVPEPSTFTFLVLGLGLVSYRAHGRRSRQ